MPASSLALKSSFDALNLAEASLISCLTRLKAGENSWEHTFVVGGREMHVACLGNMYGFPHGPDNDTMMILTNLYLEQGQPDDRALHCTAYSLLKMLGRSDSKANYRILHDSLIRLEGTLFKVSGWLDQPGGTARRVTFRFLERLEEVQAGASKLNLKSFGSGTQLKIVLDPEVAASLSSPRVRPFDLVFMMGLGSTQCRLLFRLLDTYWHSESSVSKQNFLEFEIVELGRLLRMTNLRPDSIKRTIEPMNAELKNAGFLTSADFSGRGVKQRIKYVINPQRPDYPLTVEQLELVGRVKKMDIPDIQARDYVRERTVLQVREKLLLAEGILAKTVTFRKTKSAYAWDILTDQRGKYGTPAPVPPEKTPQPSAVMQSADDAHAAFEGQMKAQAALPPAEQWAMHQQMLKFHMQKKLTKEEYAALGVHCKSGEMSANSIAKDLTHSLALLQTDKFVEQLKSHLAELT